MLRTTAAALVLVLSAPAVAEETPAPEVEPDSIDWLWLSIGAGFQWVDMRTFRVNPDQLSGSLIPANTSGPSPSLGLGVRLKFLSLGLRATTVRFLSRPEVLEPRGNRELSSFDLEIGFRSSLGRWQPFLILGGGYSTLGHVGDALEGVAAGLDIDGLNLTAAGGVNYFLTRKLSLALRAGTSIVVLAPEGMTIQEFAAPKRITNLLQAHEHLVDSDGSSVGWTTELSLGVGVHF